MNYYTCTHRHTLNIKVTNTNTLTKTKYCNVVKGACFLSSRNSGLTASHSLTGSNHSRAGKSEALLNTDAFRPIGTEENNVNLKCCSTWHLC